MSFSKIYGHETVKKSLQAAISNDRISNAYVFEGIEGVGKKLCAKIFAQSLVCESDTPPCGKCSACVQAIAGTAPDIITLTKDKDKASIGVDNVREQIISEVYLKPRNAKRKIFLINNGDELSTEAQNALLKVLEEPPAYVTFIICVTAKEKLLQTVLSRSQTVTFFPVAKAEVVRCLKENSSLDEDNAQFIASLAQGSIGKAIALSSDNSKKERMDKTVQALINLKKNSLRIREMVDFLTEEKENVTEIFECMCTFLRDCVMVKTNMENSVIFFDKLSDMRVFVQDLSKKRLISAFDKIKDLELKLKQNLNFNAAVSEAVMRIWEDFHDEGSGHKI